MTDLPDRQRLPTQSVISSACLVGISVHLLRQQLPTHYSVWAALSVQSVTEISEYTETKDLERKAFHRFLFPDYLAACCLTLQIRQQLLTLIR